MGDLEVLTLAYLYWEPANAAAEPVFLAHRDEVARFAGLVASDTTCRLVHASYHDLWRQWANVSGSPAWLPAHLELLQRRYLVDMCRFARWRDGRAHLWQAAREVVPGDRWCWYSFATTAALDPAAFAGHPWRTLEGGRVSVLLDLALAAGPPSDRPVGGVMSRTRAGDAVVAAMPTADR